MLTTSTPWIHLLVSRCIWRTPSWQKKNWVLRNAQTTECMKPRSTDKQTGELNRSRDRPQSFPPLNVHNSSPLHSESKVVTINRHVTSSVRKYGTIKWIGNGSIWVGKQKITVKANTKYSLTVQMHMSETPTRQKITPQFPPLAVRSHILQCRHPAGWGIFWVSTKARWP